MRFSWGLLKAAPPESIESVAAAPASEWVTAKEMKKKVTPPMAGGAVHLTSTCRTD